MFNIVKNFIICIIIQEIQGTTHSLNVRYFWKMILIHPNCRVQRLIDHKTVSANHKRDLIMIGKN